MIQPDTWLKPLRLTLADPVLATEYATVRGAIRLLGWRRLVRYLRSPDARLVPRILRAYGATVPARTTFKGAIHLDNVAEDQDSFGDLRNLVFGNNCYVGDGVYFDLANRISIGDDAVISGHVSFVTHADCNRSPRLSRAFPRRCDPITVGHGSWIGFGATILTGVTISPNAMVAAHALVNADVEEEKIVGGVPARELGSISSRCR